MDAPAPVVDTAAPISPPAGETSAILRVLAWTRYILLVPVLGSFLASVTLLLYGGAAAIGIIYELVMSLRHGGLDSKALSVEFVQVIDEFLLGTVFYIIAVGFYQLFISRDLRLPSWLETRSLDDLKDKMVRIVIVLLGIIFLQQVVRWDGQRELLGFGLSIALVILALSLILWLHQREAPTPANRHPS
jgi:uncharacterized membrane protein YqhA